MANMTFVESKRAAPARLKHTVRRRDETAPLAMTGYRGSPPTRQRAGHLAGSPRCGNTAGTTHLRARRPDPKKYGEPG